jgi:hypothetical protein
MKRSISTVLMAALLAFAVVPATQANVVTLPVSDGVAFAGTVPKGSFTDQFSFSLSGDSLVSGLFLKGLISNIDLSFKSVAASTWTPVTIDFSGPLFTSFALGSTALSSGNYLFQISGTGLGNIAGFRAYSGALAVAPVPEPETWAMLVVGSLLVGYQLRRKQKGLSQQPLAA